MSFYNMLFGLNPSTEQILGALNLKKNDIERFRDCHIEEDRICIFTRTGGGNRDMFPNETLTSHPLYLFDRDDSFDSTYAHYYFSLRKSKEG